MEAGNGRVHQQSRGPVAGRSDISGKGLARSRIRQFARWRLQRVRLVARQLCCSHGVRVSLLGQYLAFAAELNRLGDPACDGRILRAIVPRLVVRWAERGLDGELLRKLVYNLTNVVVGH